MFRAQREPGICLGAQATQRWQVDTSPGQRARVKRLLSIGGIPPGGTQGEGPVMRSGLRVQYSIAALWDMKSLGQNERGAVAAG